MTGDVEKRAEETRRKGKKKDEKNAYKSPLLSKREGMRFEAELCALW